MAERYGQAQTCCNLSPVSVCELSQAERPQERLQLNTRGGGQDARLFLCRGLRQSEACQLERPQERHLEPRILARLLRVLDTNLRSSVRRK